MPEPTAEQIFHAARDLQGEERSRYLEEACGDDASLRAQVDALLEADAAAGSFMATESDTTTGGVWQRSGETTFPGPREETGLVIDRYKLLEQIGEGGFGTVWMAEQREPVKRRVALKIIKLGMDTKHVIARFEAERQALAMMDHPNIAKIHDAGSTETGRPYFVMEYIRGVPILEYCDTEKLDTTRRLELFTQVCRAIQHAHQKGIIHRDVKPSNVLITMNDGVPVPKVIDFGIAKATNTELTQKTLFTEHRQVIGTPAYMSPEQAEMSGLDIDTRSDVYSLGVLLYELLVGTTPFDTQSLMEAGFAEMMRIIREEEPSKPSTRLSSLGDTATQTAEKRRADIKRLGLILRGDLDWIVMKCLEKDRTRRYETANGLALDIERHLADEPVLAGAPSAGYRFRKFVRRNRGQVVAGALVMATLVLGIAGTTNGMFWALSEKERADTQADLATKTAGELRQVADFQASQFLDLDVATMGVRLRASLIDAAVAGGAPREAFEQSVVPVNFTNLALGSLRENIFRPSLAAIDADFADQPLVRAQLLQTMVEILRVLGLFDAATGPQERALAIRRAELGDVHPDTLTSINSAAMLLIRQNRLDQAERLAVEAIDIQDALKAESRHVPGPRGEDANNVMGSLRMFQLKPAEAETHLVAFLDDCRIAYGEDHMATCAALNNLGEAQAQQGKFAQAEQHLIDAIAISRRVMGDDHWGTVHAIGNMGFLMNVQERFGEAEPYLDECLERARSVWGDDHPQTLRVLNNYSLTLSGLGRGEEALALADEQYERSQRILPPHHPMYMSAPSRRGQALLVLARYDEAVTAIEEAYNDIVAVVKSESHPWATVNAGRLAGAYDAWHAAAPGQGHDAKAEEWRARAQPAGE